MRKFLVRMLVVSCKSSFALLPSVQECVCHGKLSEDEAGLVNGLMNESRSFPFKMHIQPLEGSTNVGSCRY